MGSEKLLNLATKSLNWQHYAHLYYSPLSLSDCSSTRILKCRHTYRNIWTTANQRGSPPFTISDWFRPRYGPNMCLLLNHRETFRVAETFFFLERLVAQVRSQIFFSRTIEKLGRTCDQIGCTLEPCGTVHCDWPNTTSTSYKCNTPFHNHKDEMERQLMMSLVLPSVQGEQSHVIDTVMKLVCVCKQAAINTISDSCKLCCDVTRARNLLFYLGAPQMFYEHPLNIKEQRNRQLSGRACNILSDD